MLRIHADIGKLISHQFGKSFFPGHLAHHFGIVNAQGNRSNQVVSLSSSGDFPPYS